MVKFKGVGSKFPGGQRKRWPKNRKKKTEK